MGWELKVIKAASYKRSITSPGGVVSRLLEVVRGMVINLDSLFLSLSEDSVSVLVTAPQSLTN